MAVPRSSERVAHARVIESILLDARGRVNSPGSRRSAYTGGSPEFTQRATAARSLRANPVATGLCPRVLRSRRWHAGCSVARTRSEEHTSELQSLRHLV